MLQEPAVGTGGLQRGSESRTGGPFRPPPKDGDEWLAREGMATLFPEIPESFVRQHKIDYHADTLVGTEEEICESLREKSAMDFSEIERLSVSIEKLMHDISQLHILNAPGGKSGGRTWLPYPADTMSLASRTPSVPNPSRDGGGGGVMATPSHAAARRTVLFEEDGANMSDSNPSGSLVPVETSPRPRMGRRGRDRQGNRPLGVASVKFPGFDPLEATSLPVIVEPAELLSEPVTHLNVPDKFKRKWRRVMTSDMSVLMLQDVFWWIYLEHFSPDAQSQDLLFGRVADTFVCMLDSPSLERFRDDLFQMYPHCLAQSVLYAFCRMFPSSLALFDEDFRTELANTVWLWISGINCPPQRHWSNWPLNRLGVNRKLLPVPSPSEAAAYAKALKNLVIVPPPHMAGDLKVADREWLEKLKRPGSTATGVAGTTSRPRGKPARGSVVSSGRASAAANTSVVTAVAASQPRTKPLRDGATTSSSTTATAVSAGSGSGSGRASAATIRRDVPSAGGQRSRSAARPGTGLSSTTQTSLKVKSEGRPRSAPLSYGQVVARQLEYAGVKSPRSRREEQKPASMAIHCNDEYKHVVFNHLGRSPLVQHYAECHRNFVKQKAVMVREEIEPDRSDVPKPTFQDVLTQTQTLSQKMEERYRKAVEDSVQQAAVLQEEFATTKKHIERDMEDKCLEIQRRRLLLTAEDQIERMLAQEDYAHI